MLLLTCLVFLALSLTTNAEGNRVKSCLKEACESYKLNQNDNSVISELKGLNYSLETCDYRCLYLDVNHTRRNFSCDETIVPPHGLISQSETSVPQSAQADDQNEITFTCIEKSYPFTYHYFVNASESCERINNQVLEKAKDFRRTCSNNGNSVPSNESAPPPPPPNPNN